MIDNFSILFSTILAVYVTYRAMVLDRKLPWFVTKAIYAREQAKAAEAAARASRNYTFDSAPKPNRPAR